MKINDGDRFRYWVEAAANEPGKIAKAIAHCIHPSEYREAIDKLILATPQTEEVEVKRWVAVGKLGDVESTCRSVESLDHFMEEYPQSEGYVIVELTGHYQRPVRRKVKRREEITISDDATWRFKNPHIDPSGPYKFFVEYEEDGEKP